MSKKALHDALWNVAIKAEQMVKTPEEEFDGDTWELYWELRYSLDDLTAEIDNLEKGPV